MRAPLQERFPGLGEQSCWGVEPQDDEAAWSVVVGNGRVRGRVHAGGVRWGSGSDPGGVRSLGFVAPVQRMRRLRRAAVVVTESVFGGGAVLRRLHWAGEGEDRIYQLHELESARGPSPRVSGLPLAPVDGAADRFVGALAVGPAEAGGAGFRPVPVDAAVRSLGATLRAWRARFEGASTVDTDLVRLRDLVETVQVDLLAAQDDESGAVLLGPGAEAHDASIRSQTGPLLAFLRMHHWRAARAILDFEWRLATRLGRLPGYVTAAELRELAGRAPLDEVDWARFEVPRAELQTLVVLHHFWYWRTTRDLGPIEEHWPLIDTCLKRSRPVDGALVPFEGGEPWFGGWPDRDDGDAVLGAGAARPESRWSFANAVAVMLAVQATGELLDARDAARRPEAWRGGPPDERPGSRYVRRGFEMMRAVEDRFWLADQGRFAPALSAIDGRPVSLPLAHENLTPLWLGWTFPSGEKSRDNLRSALAACARREGPSAPVAVGAAPGTVRATGDLQGMLLAAVSELDGASRPAVLDELLRQALPAGTWPRWVGPDLRRGLADPDMAGRNLDALLFALTGIRHAAVPNWDDDDVRLEFRLPQGASYLTVRSAEKDGRRLNLYVRETFEPLTDEELAAQEERPPEERRDPGVPHRRIRFRIEQASEDPAKGYWDVAANVAGTVYVRYLRRAAPVDEVEFPRADDAVFLAATDQGAGEGVDGEGDPAAPPPLPEPEHPMLVLCASPARAPWFDGVATVVDATIPVDLEALRALLLGPKVNELYLDRFYGVADPDAWSEESGHWARLLAEFEASGGTVVRPGYLRRASAVGPWGTRPIEADGPVVNLPGDCERVVFEAVSSVDGPAVLRIGCGNAGSTAEVLCNGKRVAEVDDVAGRRVPDAESHRIELVRGPVRLEVVFGDAVPDGERFVALRVTDQALRPVVVQPADGGR